MLKKDGKFYARWTDAEGRRRSKACKSKAAANRYQSAQRKAAHEKKSQTTRRSLR